MTRLVSAIYKDYYPFNEAPALNTVPCVPVDRPEELQAGDVLIVWGGQDISPSLYNKEVSLRTHARKELSIRDKIEWDLMQRAKELGCPIIGVCRGAQMLCALAGGFLIQDVTNHHGKHYVYTDEGLEIQVNSIHHQMMYPFDVKHEMLCATKPLSRHHLDVNTDIKAQIPFEPEFVYFPEIKGFAIQWHPEAMRLDCAATQYIFKQLEKRL